jgi:hypothetical protein
VRVNARPSSSPPTAAADPASNDRRRNPQGAGGSGGPGLGAGGVGNWTYEADASHRRAGDRPGVDATSGTAQRPTRRRRHFRHRAATDSAQTPLPAPRSENVTPTPTRRSRAAGQPEPRRSVVVADDRPGVGPQPDLVDHHRRHRDRVQARPRRCAREGCSPVQRPALSSTRAGTPASRSAAALIRLRLAHDTATLTNAFSNSGSRAAWSICASCASMSRRCWISSTSRMGDDSSAIHCSIWARRFSRPGCVPAPSAPAARSGRRRPRRFRLAARLVPSSDPPYAEPSQVSCPPVGGLPRSGPSGAVSGPGVNCPVGRTALAGGDCGAQTYWRGGAHGDGFAVGGSAPPDAPTGCDHPTACLLGEGI